MRAILLGDAMEVLTVQSNSVFVLLAPIAFVGREINDTLLGIHTVDALDLPITVGELSLHLGGAT